MLSAVLQKNNIIFAQQLKPVTLYTNDNSHTMLCSKNSVGHRRCSYLHVLLAKVSCEVKNSQKRLWCICEANRFRRCVAFQSYVDGLQISAAPGTRAAGTAWHQMHVNGTTRWKVSACVSCGVLNCHWKQGFILWWRPLSPRRHFVFLWGCVLYFCALPWINIQSTRH